MAVNVTFCFPVEKSTINSAQPVLNGEPIVDPVDVTPTGSWAAVDLPALPDGVRGCLVHLVADGAARIQVKATTPDTSAGTLMLAGSERTIGIQAGKKLWIK